MQPQIAPRNGSGHHRFVALLVLVALSTAALVSQPAAASGPDDLDDAARRALTLTPRTVAAQPLNITFANSVPADARSVVADVVTKLSAAIDFNAEGRVDIGVSFETMTSLGHGGPVLVRVGKEWLPAALADTLYGGQHAGRSQDGFVVMSADQPWSYASEEGVPTDRYDFATAFTHELIHALGFVIDRTGSPGRVHLSGKSSAVDRHLVAAGRPLQTLPVSEQATAFAADDIWFDIGGGRLVPIDSSGGRGGSHFAFAVSETDGKPGSILYRKLPKGERRHVDAPALGALAQLGYPMVVPPTAPRAARVDADAVRWVLDLSELAPPPTTTRVEFRNGRSVVRRLELAGAIERIGLPPRPFDSVTLWTRSASGVESAPVMLTVGDPSIGTMAAARSMEELVAASDYEESYGDVLRLYWAFFTRQPDLAGAKYWIALRRDSTDLDEVAEAFADSREFRARYGSLDDAGYVELIYRNVLGRSRDNGGFSYWLGLLSRGELDRGGIVRWIASAQEFVRAHPF